MKHKTGNPRILILGLLLLFQGMQSVHWEVTTGEILKAEIEEDIDDYFVDIRYRYSVGGKIYESDTVSSANGLSMSYQQAENYVAKYLPVEKIVNVYYNPRNPSISVLETGNSLRAYWLPVMGLIVLVFGLLGIIERRRKGER